MSGNPYAKFAQPQNANPYARFTQPGAEPAPSGDFRIGAGPQLAMGATEGLASLPGLPVDAIVGGGNFIRRQFDIPETKLEDTPLKDWGGQGWRDANLSRLDALTGQTHDIPNPQGGVATFARKAGNFVGGALPFGPAGMVPALTGAVASEGGKKLDEVAPDVTKGYGEFVGGVVGGAAPGLRRLVSRPRSTAPVMSDAEILAAKNAAYKAAEDAGVVYTPQFTQRLGMTVSNDLAGKAFDEVMHPLVARALKRIFDRSETNVTLADVDNLRQLAGNAAGSVVPKEQMLASRIIEHIDNAIDNPAAGDVLMGDAAAGSAAIREARALNQRVMKAKRINDALANAETQNDSTYSGGNIDNATRQKLRPMITRGNKQSRGWTPDEIAALRKVNKGGGVGQQLLRQVGKLSPEGGFGKYLLAAFSGGSLANPAVAPMFGLSAAGFVSKRIADAMTRSNVNELLDTVRRGGEAYQPRRMLTGGPSAVAKELLPGVPGATQKR